MADKDIYIYSDGTNVNTDVSFFYIHYIVQSIFTW